VVWFWIFGVLKIVGKFWHGFLKTGKLKNQNFWKIENFVALNTRVLNLKYERELLPVRIIS